MARNPRIVYGRMTGFGPDGPIAHTAGHDINYIALTGALYATGSAASGPVPPRTHRRFWRRRSCIWPCAPWPATSKEPPGTGLSGRGYSHGRKGAASLMASHFGRLASGAFIEQRESNRLMVAVITTIPTKLRWRTSVSVPTNRSSPC